jgi:hypothetical protein
VDNSVLLIVCLVGAVLAAASVAVAKKAKLVASPEQPKLRRTISPWEALH